MSPQKNGAKKLRRARSKIGDMSARDFIELIPLWGEIGYVLGHAKRFNKIPKVSADVRAALINLNKLRRSLARELDVSKVGNVIEEFDKYVLRFARASTKTRSSKFPEFASLTDDFKKFVLKIGGKWPAGFAKDLTQDNILARSRNLKGYEKAAANILSKFIPEPFAKFCTQTKYEVRKSSSGRTTKLIAPDFSWFPNLLTAAEVPIEELEAFSATLRKEDGKS